METLSIMTDQYQEGVHARKIGHGSHINPYRHQRPELIDFLVQPSIFKNLIRAADDWDEGWKAEDEWERKTQT
jgi:hypothetical protein